MGNPDEQFYLEAATCVYHGNICERSVLKCIVLEQADAPDVSPFKYSEVYAYISDTPRLRSILEANAIGLGESSVGLRTCASGASVLETAETSLSGS